MVVLAVKDWNEALDQRDRGEFDALWVESNEYLKKLDYKTPTDEMEISALREFFFQESVPSNAKFRSRKLCV